MCKLQLPRQLSSKAKQATGIRKVTRQQQQGQYLIPGSLPQHRPAPQGRLALRLPLVLHLLMQPLPLL